MTDPNVDRAVQPSFEVTTPASTINLLSPPTFADPSGLAGVLTTVQKGDLFRDMSKAAELATVIGHLTTMATEMGKAASQMTGGAAQQALSAATSAAGTAGSVAQSMSQQAGFGQTAKPPESKTDKGATINELQKLLKQLEEAQEE